MKSAFILSAAAAAAVVAASPASAAVQVTQTLNFGLPIVVPPSQSFHVGADFTADSTATAWYTFTLGSAQTLSASAFSTDAISDLSYSFASLSLHSGATGTGATLETTSNVMPASGGGSVISLSPITLAAGTYTVSVIGNATNNASIGGSISFAAAIPEVGTWAMMIAGFGLVGGAMRRRQSVRVRFA